VLVSGGAGEAFRYVRRVREIDPESEVMVMSSLEVRGLPGQLKSSNSWSMEGSRRR